MSMLEGISQCWPLGEKCHVWWDAWTFVVAVAALWVAYLTMLVTIGSCWAVYYLGTRANRLAEIAQESQRTNADVAAKEQKETRQREENVALAYCATEFGELKIFLASLAALMKPGAAMAVEEFVAHKASRAFFAERLRQMSTEHMDRMLPRLHMLPSGNGLKIARLVGLCKNLATRSEAHATYPPSEPRTQEEADTVRTHLETCHANRLSEAEQAIELADQLSTRAIAVLRAWRTDK